MKAKLLAEIYRRPIVNEQTGRVTYKTFRKGDVVELTEEEENSLMRDSFSTRQMFMEVEDSKQAAQPKSTGGTPTPSDKK